MEIISTLKEGQKHLTELYQHQETELWECKKNKWSDEDGFNVLEVFIFIVYCL